MCDGLLVAGDKHMEVGEPAWRVLSLTDCGLACYSEKAPCIGSLALYVLHVKFTADESRGGMMWIAFVLKCNLFQAHISAIVKLTSCFPASGFINPVCYI